MKKLLTPHVPAIGRPAGPAQHDAVDPAGVEGTPAALKNDLISWSARTRCYTVFQPWSATPPTPVRTGTSRRSSSCRTVEDVRAILKYCAETGAEPGYGPAPGRSWVRPIPSCGASGGAWGLTASPRTWPRSAGHRRQRRRHALHAAAERLPHGHGQLPRNSSSRPPARRRPGWTRRRRGPTCRPTALRDGPAPGHRPPLRVVRIPAGGTDPMTKKSTVRTVTYDLLRSLGLTTVFGNPGRPRRPSCRNSPTISATSWRCRRLPPSRWPTPSLRSPGARPWSTCTPRRAWATPWETWSRPTTETLP